MRERDVVGTTRQLDQTTDSGGIPNKGASRE